MTFTHRHRVRYHEVDLQSFLFNGRYLEIADVAMSEFFRDLGWSYPDLIAAGMDPSVVSAAIQFAAPARLDDLVDVRVRCPRVGTSRLRALASAGLRPRACTWASITF